MISGAKGDDDVATSTTAEDVMTATTISSAEEEEKPMSDAEKKVRKFVGKCVEIVLSDGRRIRGRILCTDKEPNIILGKAYERWQDEDEPRFIGQAMVTRQHITKMVFIDDLESSV